MVVCIVVSLCVSSVIECGSFLEFGACLCDAFCLISGVLRGLIISSSIMYSKVCSNASRVFVQESVVDKFTELLVKRTRAMKIGDPMRDDTTVGATINTEHVEKVMAFIERAKQEVMDRLECRNIYEES